MLLWTVFLTANAVLVDTDASATNTMERSLAAREGFAWAYGADAIFCARDMFGVLAPALTCVDTRSPSARGKPADWRNCARAGLVPDAPPTNADVVEFEELPAMPAGFGGRDEAEDGCVLKREAGRWQCCNERALHDCRDDQSTVTACAAVMGLTLDPPGNDEAVLKTTQVAYASYPWDGSADDPPADTHGDEPCHTAVEGEDCYDHVKWAMETGIELYPEKYPGLTVRSRFEEFQEAIHRYHPSCNEPCWEGVTRGAGSAEKGCGEGSTSGKPCPPKWKKHWRKALFVAAATLGGVAAAHDPTLSSAVKPYVDSAVQGYRGAAERFHGAPAVNWDGFNRLEDLQVAKKKYLPERIFGAAAGGAAGGAAGWAGAGMVIPAVGINAAGAPVAGVVVGAAAVQHGVKEYSAWMHRNGKNQRMEDYKAFQLRERAVGAEALRAELGVKCKKCTDEELELKAFQQFRKQQRRKLIGDKAQILRSMAEDPWIS